MTNRDKTREQELETALQQSGATEALIVGEDASGASQLETFLKSAGSLTPAERLAIVNQAILLLEGFYVHLPLKRAMHGVDPLQRLRLLRRRIDQLGGETRFHAEMTAIFTSVRDLHTNYMLPSPYAEVAAVLPFRVEA